MHQYTSARERQRETEWEKREREGREGCARPSLIHPPPPFRIREEGYPSFPSSQHRDLLSAVSSPAASHYGLGHDIRHLHWKSLPSAYECTRPDFFTLIPVTTNAFWMAFIPAIRSLNIKNIKRSLVELRWILEAVLQRLLLWFSHVGCCFFCLLIDNNANNANVRARLLGFNLVCI